MDIALLREKRLEKKWEEIVALCTLIDPPSIMDRVELNRFLDEYYIALYRLGRFEDCLRVMSYFTYCHVDDHIIRNTDYMLSYLKTRGGKNRRVVATYDLNRQPTEDEIVICYGDFPSLYDNLIHNNPVRRHLKYFFQMDHDEVEASSTWEKIDRIYIVNLDERVDRYIETLRELKRMQVPLSIVERWSAARYQGTSDPSLNGHLGCMKSHIEIFEHANKKGYNHIIVLEDDFCFTEQLEQHHRDLTTFFERKYDYDVVLLATSRYYRCEPFDDLLVRSFQECTTTAGYMVSEEGRKRILPIWKNGYEKMVETGRSDIYAVDRCWSALQVDNKFFVFKTKFGFQRPGYSNITKETAFGMD